MSDHLLSLLCGRFGHWLTYVEEGHARCRVCRAHLFCSHYDYAEDPLTLAVNRAFNTGEPVLWTEGDPLPDPAGPIRRIEDA